jgi:hypothetical protein
VQLEFRTRFKKDVTHKNSVLFKPCTKFTLHCNHRSGHLKTEHLELRIQVNGKFNNVVR